MTAHATVVTARSEQVLAVLGDQTALTAGEQARAARLVPGARDDFVAAHLLVRAVVTHVLGRTVTITQRCPRCAGEHGPPTIDVPDYTVSWSHSRGQVAAGVAPAVLGVDVEARVPGTTVLPSVLTPAEQRAVSAETDPVAAFLRMWVRKEALVKAGVTTLDAVDRLEVSQPRRGRLHGLQLAEWQAGDAVGAAVCRVPMVVGGPDLVGLAGG